MINEYDASIYSEIAENIQTIIYKLSNCTYIKIKKRLPQFNYLN